MRQIDTLEDIDLLFSTGGTTSSVRRIDTIEDIDSLFGGPSRSTDYAPSAISGPFNPAYTPPEEPEYLRPVEPVYSYVSPATALQRQVDATIAARETSQRYATLPKPIADVYNVYKDEDLAREARDLADQLKREYPEYGEDIEDLLMKGLRPEDIRTQITQKRERKRRQSELATQYPDFAKDVGKLFDQGFSADEVEAQVGAMARSAYEQRQAKEALQYGKIAERGISLPPAQPVKEEGPSIGQQAAGLGAEVAIGATSQAAGAALAPVTWGISYPVLSFAGGFTGSLAAQEIEGRDTISYGRAIRDGLLNLIPAGKGVKAATVGGKIAKTAVRGAVAGAPIGAVGAVIETGIEEQRLPTFEEITSQAAGGAVSGAVIGGAFAGFGEAFKSAYSKFAGKTTKQLDDAYRAGDPDAKLVVDTMKKVSRDAPDDVSPTSVIDRAEDIEKRAEAEPVDLALAPTREPVPVGPEPTTRPEPTPEPEPLPPTRPVGPITEFTSADDLRTKLQEKIAGATNKRQAIEEDASYYNVSTKGKNAEQIINEIAVIVGRAKFRATTLDMVEEAIRRNPSDPRAAAKSVLVLAPEYEVTAALNAIDSRRAAIRGGEQPPVAEPEPITIPRPTVAEEPPSTAPRQEEPVPEPARVEEVATPAAQPQRLEDLDLGNLRAEIDAIASYQGKQKRLNELAEQFGVPTGGTPKEILGRIEEAYNAAKERQVTEGGVGEYRGDGARVQEEGQDRIVTPEVQEGRPEAGGGYRPATGGNVPPGPVGRGVQGQQAVTPPAGGAVPPTTPPPAAGGAAGAAGAPAPAGRVYKRPADVGEKISSIFGKIGENIKAQNVAARSLEENRQMGDAASNIGREAFSSIKYIQDKLSKTAGARQVEDDLSKIVENTGSVTVPAANITVGGKQVSFAGGTFSREDIKDMSYSELVEIAKAGGWYNSKMNSADDLKKLALQQTKSDMTVDDFVSKYNLSTDDAQLLKRPFDDAKDFAKTLGAEVEYTGLVDLGNYIASQGAYAQRKYLRNIAKGQFEPTPAARIEAEGVVEQAINRRIDQRSGRLAKIDSKGVNIASYMNTDDPKQAAQIISGLDLDTQRELVDMRDFYRKAMNQAVNVVEQTTPTGRTYTFDKKASDIKTMASHIVDQMVKPPDDALKSPTSGGGSAMDSLMKRDLDQVFQRLFGRIKDPAVVMAASRETQASLIGRYQSIRKLAESSELFTDDPVLASQKKWVRLAGSQRSTDPITDNDRKRYGVLAGMHAPESVKALLTNEKYYAASFIPQTIRGVEDALNKVSSVTRGGKVIFAPKSSIRDALTTAVTSSLGSGDIPLNPKQWTKEVSDVYSILRKYAVAKANGDQKGIADAQRFFRYLAETGIYKPGSSSYWDDMANAINGEGKISTIWKNLAAGRSYLTDMPFKVAGYNVRYKEALKWGWSEQKAKAWALDNIRRHYDNRDAVPKAFRDVAAKSTSPDYLPFKYSIARARMLQAVDAFSRDLKNKDIPPEAKARIIYGFFASTATTPALAIGKYGNKILKYGGLLSTIYKGTEVMSDNAETADDEVDNAVRYISPGFAQRDPMVTFVDDKDGKKRIITFSLTGAFTANPLEEYALGGYQTAGDKGLSKSMIEKLVEYGAGGDVPMVPNMLYQFLAGEPLGAYYDNEGFPGAVIKSGRALSNAMKLTGDAREEQFSLSKQYGTDALIRLAELATAPLGSVIQTPVKAISMEKRKKELEKEITQERKGGRVPIGYGEEEGRPASDYMPTRTISDMLIQGIAPHNVRIMEERDALFNLRAKAKTLKRYTTDVSDETAQAKRELDSDERRKAKKPLLDSYFTDWKEQSEQLLSLFGSKDIRKDQADILAKAGLADWEIEYILGISPPTKSELPGLKNLSGGLKTIK